MSTAAQYTDRDRLKFACYSYALNKGLDETQMVDLFTKAAELVKSTKQAFLPGGAVPSAVAGIGTLLAGPPIAALTGHMGYTAGQVARRFSHGRVPTPDEVHLTDETAEYEDAIEEVKQRIMLNRLRRQQSQTPSSRRIF